MFSAAIKGPQQLDRTAATKLFVYKTPAGRHRNLTVSYWSRLAFLLKNLLPIEN